jgi:hypothetical protein
LSRGLSGDFDLRFMVTQPCFNQVYCQENVAFCS